MSVLYKRYLRPGARVRRYAEADGWHPGERCECAAATARPALVGGDGYWLAPLMCCTCRRAA